MALIRSIVAGAGTSLLVANLAHREGSGDGGTLGIVDFTAFGHRVAWSWLVFAIATLGVWLLVKAVNYSSMR